MPNALEGTRFLPADLATFIDILAADLNPLTGNIVYGANTADKKTALERSVLWLRNSDGQSRILAPSEFSQIAPAISPAGTSTAFHQVTGSAFQLYVVDHDSAETIVLTDFERGTFPLRATWSPQGNKVAFVANAEPARNAQMPYRVDRPVWRLDGLGLIDDVKGEIWTVDAAGGTPVSLTNHDALILSIAWSHCGEKILYSTIAGPRSQRFAVRTLNVKSGVSTVVLEDEFIGYPPTASWMPDGRIIYATPWEINIPRDLHIYNPEDGHRVDLGLSFDGQLFGSLEPGFSAAILGEQILVDDAGQNAFVSVQNRGRVETVQVSLSAPYRVNTVAESTSSTYPLAVGDGTILLARMSISSPVELILHRDTSAEDEIVTDVDRARFEHPSFTPHHFSCDGPDGVAVDAWFLEPLMGAAPFPTVVRLHGGPFAAIGQTFSVDDAVLTSAGYGVLLINFRGSSGYGEEFSAPLRGGWGGSEAADVLACVQESISRGWVDPARMAAFGLSGGGYLVSWLLTQTDIFATGISECGISNWSSMIGSDIPDAVAIWMQNPIGTGPQSLNEYTRVSPVTYAAQCTTPLLIIEHERDLRCPPEQGDILFGALSRAGAEVEMFRMPGMFHAGVFDIGNLPSRIARSTELLSWLARYM